MEGVFTFLWRLENFSHCIQKTGEVLTSPVFVVDDLNETQWRLHLYPRGHESDEHVNLYICRENTGPGSIRVHYELSFLTADDDTYLIAKGCITDFLRNTSHLLPKRQIEREEFESERALFLKEDVLTVRCRLWRPDSRCGENVQCFGLSRIAVERRSIIWAIEKFSTLRLKESRDIRVLSASVVHPPFTLCVSLVGKSVADGSVQIKVSLVNPRHPKLLTCKISVLDSAGKVAKESQEQHWLEIKRARQTWTFPEFVTRKELFKERLVLGDVLFLRCECAISSGVGLERIEGTHYVPSALQSADLALQELNSSLDQTPDNTAGHPIEEICEAVTILQDDLRSLYVGRTLSDFELRSGDVSFPVHKSVLSARSPAFRDMFSQVVKSRVLDVRDVDIRTLDRMLTFLYTGTAEHLQWEDAAKLYYAADKYEVLSLKQKCSSLLAAEVGISNVCELLNLASRHGDDDLKASAVDFILRHEDEVITSAEWKKFMECDLQLAAKTLHRIFSKKLEPKEE